MAKAADSPIGFRSPSKGPEPDLSPPHTTSLTELHTWQACPAGLIAADVAGLVSTLGKLRSLSATPLGLRLLAVELPDLQSAQTELDQLIGRIYRSQGVAA